MNPGVVDGNIEQPRSTQRREHWNPEAMASQYARFFGIQNTDEVVDFFKPYFDAALTPRSTILAKKIGQSIADQDGLMRRDIAAAFSQHAGESLQLLRGITGLPLNDQRDKLMPPLSVGQVVALLSEHKGSAVAAKAAELFPSALQELLVYLKAERDREARARQRSKMQAIIDRILAEPAEPSDDGPTLDAL